MVLDWKAVLEETGLFFILQFMKKAPLYSLLVKYKPRATVWNMPQMFLNKERKGTSMSNVTHIWRL